MKRRLTISAVAALAEVVRLPSNRRSIRRSLFVAVSALSLLLCSVTVALWVWSYQVPEKTLCEYRFGLLSVWTFPGGIGWQKKIGIERADFSVRYWQIVLLTLALPLWPIVRRLGKWESGVRHELGRPIETARLQAETTCQTCGYDLRASKNRCPECGTLIEPKASGTA